MRDHSQPLFAGELKSLKEKVKTDSRKELQNLVKENRDLSKKLELATGTSKGASVGGAKGGASRESVSSEGSTLTVEQADNGFERVSVSPSRGKYHQLSYVLHGILTFPLACQKKITSRVD